MRAWMLLPAFWMAAGVLDARPLAAQTLPRSETAQPSGSLDAVIGRRVAAVRLERLGQTVTDTRLLDLVETRAGAPLSAREVRNSVLHLFNTGSFEDVTVEAEPGKTTSAPGTDGGITLVYRLRPSRTVARYDFRGELGLEESALRRLLTDRYGARPLVGRVQGAVAALETYYRDAGFLNAKVSSSVESLTPETAALALTVTSGARARLGRIEVQGAPVSSSPLSLAARSASPALASPEALRARLDLTSGEPFDGPGLQRRIDKLQQDLRNRGYYEATITPTQTARDDGRLIDLALDAEPGPRVTVRVEGSQIPSSRQEELVPVRREGSIDEDLLEDSKRRIESYLHGRGHWRATVNYVRRPTDTGLDIVFTVREGEVFRVANVDVSGNHALSRADVDGTLGVSVGDLFVESALDAKTQAVVDRYRRQGFRRMTVEQVVIPRDQPPAGRSAKDTAWVDVRLEIAEGPQTRVGAVAFSGNQAVDEASLRAALSLQPASPFYESAIASDREAIQSLYLNRGFDRVQVEATTVLASSAGAPGASAPGAALAGAASTPASAAAAPVTPAPVPGGGAPGEPDRVDVTYTIREGTQLFVDRILIVGNQRTDSATIEKSLTLKPGEPLGLAGLFESQRRLSALGLFRRVRISDVGEPGESRRDIIVNVDEAPATAIGYGAGIEAGRRLGSGPDDSATERIDIAARGFFEISRRNLFGSNRSATLFTRGSLRPRDQPGSPDRGFGFNEYRVLATLRDPAAFGTTIDAQISGYFEQAVRSSFNFRRRGVQADFARRLARRVTIVASYSFSQTELFDERISEDQRPDIDRLFPQVRLSLLSTAARRDTRDDVLDPTTGTVLGLDSDVALRGLGSEVGFVKGFGEMFWYRQVPNLRGAVFATGFRLGLARGFPREVLREIDGIVVIGPDGQPITDVITDLPASERFFAGGDTTVRGFARDTLGDPDTLINGFPRGGNALIILNGELRVPVWGDFGSVVFVDAGNVFSRVTDLDLASLRPTAGFGIRYKSPIGPIRVDLGFKLDRGFLLSGRREPLTEIHISIGQAF